jgi:KDO2-lipid IV(A) lauroyltransferase
VISGRAMNFLKPLRHRLEYSVFRAAQAAATALPLEAVSSTSGLAWRLIAPRLHRQERALRNLALAFPELSQAERERIAGAMWENLGRTFGESFHLKEIVAQKRSSLGSTSASAIRSSTRSPANCGLSSTTEAFCRRPR